MIMSEESLPFDKRERSIVANVARYHRGVLPTGDHKAYMDLKAGDRRVVDRLAAIIRVADALDVSHASVVRSAACQVRKGKVIVLLETTGYPDRELEKAHEKKDLFEKTYKRALRVRVGITMTEPNIVGFIDIGTNSVRLLKSASIPTVPTQC